MKKYELVIVDRTDNEGIILPNSFNKFAVIATFSVEESKLEHIKARLKRTVKACTTINNFFNLFK